MKNFKIFVSVVSVVLVFSSAKLQAQDQDVLVSHIPDLYYLGDSESDGVISVQACTRSQDGNQSTVANLSVIGLDCAVVAEITKSAVADFLLSLQADQTASSVFSGKKLRNMSYGAYTIALLSSAFGSVNFLLSYLDKSRKLFIVGTVSALTGAAYLFTGIHVGSEAEKMSYDFLGQQIHAGVVGGTAESHKEILEHFTDFINRVGTRPTFDEAAQTN